MTTTLSRIKAAKAADVFRQVKLPDTARALLRDELTPGEYLQVLIDQNRHGEAMRFIAYALPRREAIWWACLCVETLNKADFSASETAALRAAVRWVLAPNEANRLATYRPGQAAQLSTACGAIAMASYWSGGDVSPPEHALKIAAQPMLAPQTVHGALTRASILGGFGAVSHYKRQFVALGIGIANDKYLWNVL